MVYLYILRILKNNKDTFTNKIGRWKIDYTRNIINIKIDLANSDNCGNYDIQSYKQKQ
jgi:hypothetical protein